MDKALESGRLELLITIVNRSKTEFYCDLIQDCGVNLQFSAPAEGTASAELKELMGLSNTDKTVIFSIVREDAAPELVTLLSEKFRTVNNGKGIAFTVPLTGVIGVLAYAFMSDNAALIRPAANTPKPHRTQEEN